MHAHTHAYTHNTDNYYKLPCRHVHTHILRTLAMNTCCGGVAGVSATSVCHPFDVLRTRLVGQGEPKVRMYVTMYWNY